MANVAYLIAVKRTNLLLEVLNGSLLFSECRIRDHLLRAPLMFSGFVLIAIFAWPGSPATYAGLSSLELWGRFRLTGRFG
jgi:hypothetical protein